MHVDLVDVVVTQREVLDVCFRFPLPGRHDDGVLCAAGMLGPVCLSVMGGVERVLLEDSVRGCCKRWFGKSCDTSEEGETYRIQRSSHDATK